MTVNASGDEMSGRTACRDSRLSASASKREVRVHQIFREWWTRTLILSGDIEGVIRYDGRGFGEAVYVNGVLRGHSSPWGWTLKLVTPRVEFTIPSAHGDIPALVEVAASLLPWRFGIYRFRLCVDGVVLYDEDTADAWFAGGPGRVTDEPYDTEY